MVIAKKTIIMSVSSSVLIPMRYKKQDQITMIDTKVNSWQEHHKVCCDEELRIHIFKNGNKIESSIHLY